MHEHGALTNGRLRPRAQLELAALDKLPRNKYLAQLDRRDSSL
jgi:hypothetical protein